MTICPELAARYHESFGAEVTDVMTCPPFAVHPYTEPGRDALHRCLTYMGNLGCGRGQPLLERLESENYIQRFAPLYDGTRLRCGDVLELCRPELTELSGGEPEVGWLHFAYDFARRQLFPEKEAPAAYDAGAVFFLSLLQVLFAAEREKLPFDPAWDFAFL